MRRSLSASRSVLASLPVVVSLLLAYGAVLLSLAHQWADDPNYSHGFFVPLMAAWLAWRRRDAFIAAPRRPSAAGLAVIVAGALLYLAGVLAAELFTTRLSLVVVVAGLVLALEGGARLRVLAFPVGFLLLMIPLPYVLYYRLTFPLQIESSRLAAGFLTATGLPVLRDGNVLHLEGYSLEVVTACSGLRSIMTLGTIGVFMMDFIRMPPAGAVLYVALMVPVAVTANVARLVTTAGIASIAGPERAESFLHELSGLVLFVAGTVAMVLCAKGMQWIARARSGSRSSW
ncbi:MAG TPA: exosortase/archaeosortase family protein [Candidatus Krumholzibacteria bacterium]|nr:exosortase/archaeosortase family protein [Candidatus Krumholzibacteria bacterium]